MSHDETTHDTEAPEAKPRGVLFMAIVRWLLLLAMSALAFYSVRRFGIGGHTVETVREARYYCPMHPQITSPDPGECPICHMTLEPIPRDRTSARVSPNDAGSEVPSIALSPERRQAIDVSTTPVVRRTVTDPLRVPAVVAARENGVSQVHVRSPAFVERVVVRETGVRVGAGEVLAWIYSPAIYRAEQDLFAVSRWTAGADAGVPDDASRMSTAARETLRLLGVDERDLASILRGGTPQRDIPVRATSGGVITQRAAVPGTYAQPETVLYEISDLSHVWVLASVFERDLPRVRRGDIARFRANGDDQDIDARVSLVEPSIDAMTRTARVRLDVPNPGLRWRPGAFGEVRFAMAARDVLVVPRDAVVDTGEARYVFVETGNGEFSPRIVVAGSTVGEFTEVVSGIAEGDRIVVRGGFLLDAETRLRAVIRPGGAP